MHGLSRVCTTLALVGLAIVLGLGAACSAGPSDAEIKAVVSEAHGLDEADPLAELRSFERIDQRANDDSSYDVVVAYEIEYLKSSTDVAEELSARAAGGRGNGLFSSLQQGLGSFVLAADPFEKGDIRKFERTITLEEWESGWRAAE